MPNPSDFQSLIPDPTASKCSAFVKALLQLPNTLYQWMLAWTDSTGKPKGTLKAGEYIYSAAPLAEDSTRLLCNGQDVSQTTYALLYAAIGTTYGAAASPSTDFKLPDHRARFPIAVGSTAKPIAISLGSTGGEDEHTLLAAEMPTHTHGPPAGANSLIVVEPGSNIHDIDSGNNYNTADETGEAGGDEPHNNMPPYIGVYVYIYTGL